MAVGIVGSTGPVLGAKALAFPPGAGVGHLALLWDDLRWDQPAKPGPEGWDLVGHKTWARRLKGEDLEKPVPTNGTNQGLLVLSGAGTPRRKRDSEYARIPAGGAGFWVGWQPAWRSGNLASSTYQLGSIVRDEFDDFRHGIWCRPVASAGDYTPGSVSRYAELISLVIPPLDPPAAPRWVTSGSSIDCTVPLSLHFTHQSDVAMDRCQVQIRATSTSTWSYVTEAGELTTVSTELITSVEVATIAAGVLVAGQPYEVRVATRNEAGWSPVSTSIIIVARNPPLVTGGLITTHGDVSPVVEWQVVPSLGQQRSWSIRVAPDGAGPDGAVEGWSSGVQSGSDTAWQAPASTLLTNGGTYVAWIQVTDDALTSRWTPLTPGVISWTPPAAPSAITPLDGAPPTITAAGIPASALSLEWQIEVAGEWSPLASTPGPLATETISVPLAPYGVPTRYRVRSYEEIDNVRLPSNWVVSTPLTSSDMGAYLVSVDGGEWLSVRIITDQDRTPVMGVTSSTGLGAAYTHTQRTPPAGASGTTTLRTWTDAETAAVEEWLRTHRVWRTRWVPERDFDGGARDMSTTTMALRGAPTTGREHQTNLQVRTITIPWVEQEGN